MSDYNSGTRRFVEIKMSDEYRKTDCVYRIRGTVQIDVINTPSYATDQIIFKISDLDDVNFGGLSRARSQMFDFHVLTDELKEQHKVTPIWTDN